jgi:spoIIIJ-associated protein
VDERKDKPQDGALFVAEEPTESKHESSQKKESANAGSFEPDGKAEEAAELLDVILDIMDRDVDVDIREDDEEQIVLDVVGPDAGRVIGKKGSGLDALQFLANKIVNRSPEGRRFVIVDSGDYRERHDKGLVSLAEREAKRAIEEGRVVTLQPMSARDRRVIHLSLAKLEDVTTASQGHGQGRRIQIIPARRRGRR